VVLNPLLIGGAVFESETPQPGTTDPGPSPEPETPSPEPETPEPGGDENGDSEEESQGA
jgi:hypothetical protein